MGGPVGEDSTNDVGQGMGLTRAKGIRGRAREIRARRALRARPHRLVSAKAGGEG